MFELPDVHVHEVPGRDPWFHSHIQKSSVCFGDRGSFDFPECIELRNDVHELYGISNDCTCEIDALLADQADVAKRWEVLALRALLAQAKAT